MLKFLISYNLWEENVSSVFNIMTYTNFKYINQLYRKGTWKVDTVDTVKIQMTHGEMH